MRNNEHVEARYQRLFAKGWRGHRRRRPLGNPVATPGPESLAMVPLRPDRLPPPTVLKIPGDRLAKPAVKVLGGLPAQLAPDLGDVHGVAPVVSRSIGDEADQAPVWRIRQSKHHGTAYRKKAGQLPFGRWGRVRPF